MRWDHALSVLCDPHAADTGADRGLDRRATLPRDEARHDRAAVAQGEAAGAAREGEGLNKRQKEEYLREHQVLKSQGKPFFPYAVLKDSTMAAIVLIVIIAMAVILGGGELANKADPTTVTYTPRPDWYFYFLFELLRVIKPPSLVV